MSDCNSKSCCQPKPPARTIPIAPTGPVIRIIPAELDEPNVQAVQDAAAPNARQMTVHIAQMCCPTEERVLRSSLGKLPGVEQLDFNLMQRDLRITHTMADPAPILDTIRALAMVPVMAPAGTQRTAAMTETAATPSGATAAPAPGAAQTPAASSRAPFLRLSLGLVAAIGAEAWAWTTGNDGAWPVFALAVIAIALTGIGVYRKG